MLQFTIIPTDTLPAFIQASSVITAGCQWIEIDPSLIDKMELDKIIKLCQTNEIILIYNHNDIMLEESRVHGIHLHHGDCSASELRARLGAHPIIGVDVTDNCDLTTLKQSDVDYIVIPSYQHPTYIDTIKSLYSRETEVAVEIPIVVQGTMSPADVADIIRAGASGLNIDYRSLSEDDFISSFTEFMNACSSLHNK